MDLSEPDIKDFFLKTFSAQSLTDELTSQKIKEQLAVFVTDLDLTKDFFELFNSRLSDRRYSLNEIYQVLSTPFTELLKTLKALQKIIESYFAENNLKNNVKLRNMILDSHDGFVSLATFLKYKNVKTLTSSEKFMAKALDESGVLEVSNDRKYVRVSGKQTDESQVYYYNLDTSQTQINYSSIAEGLTLRPTIITKIKYISLLAGNSRFIAYFKPDSLHKVDLSTNEDKIIAQIKGLSYLDLRVDDDLFIGVVDKVKIIIINLLSSVQTFEYRVPEGTVEKVLFHPTDRNLLVRFAANEVVLFRINPLKSGEITWFKVVPMKSKIINVAITQNLLASAVGQGQVQVLNIETDQVLYSYCPHTYNTMMYSSNITLHFITPNFLLTSGRSQNELCLAKIDSNQRTHILTIQSLSRKHISVYKEYILISDPNSSNISLVIISETEDLLKFGKIIDYKLDSNCLLAFIGSSSQFHVVTKNDFRVYFTNIDKKIDEKIIIENSLDTNEIINALGDLASNKVKIVADKVSAFCKMNVVKKALNDGITEGVDKSSVKEIKAISEGLKKCVADSLAPGIQSAIDEMMSQVIQCSEIGIKEFSDKELELDSVYEVLQKENYQKITLISDLTDIYGKNCVKHLRKLEKLEENFKEKLLTIKNKEPTGAQEKLNILLAQGDFESALGMVVAYPSKLYSTLAVMNPTALLKGKKITQGLQNRILRQFLIFPPTLRQLKNSAEWMENLIQYKTWTQTEKDEAKRFLKNHPLAYISSFII